VIDRLNCPPSFRTRKILAVCLFAMLTACAEEDPQQYIQEGNNLFERGDVDSARVQFQNALQIQPKLSGAYYGLALIAEKKQDWKAMFGALQETVAIDPNHVDARVKLGQLYMLQGDLVKAKEQASSALALAPENIDAMIFESAVLFREGKNAEALEKINLVLAKDAGNADATISQATIFFTEKRNDEALAAVQKGIDAHPDNAGLRLLKIRFQTELKQYDEVVREFEELIAAHPEDKSLQHALIDLLINIDKADQAEQRLNEMVAKNPGDVDLKLMLVALVERRDGAAAETMLKGFVAERPDDIQLKSRFARFYADRGRSEDELAILDDIVASDPNGKEGLAAKVRLAEIAWAKSDRATAEKLTEEVIAADAGNSEALLLRSGLRLDNKDIDGAISDLRIVLRDQPNSDKAIAMMAQAYAMKGESEVAESHWRKALEIAPANLSALVPLTGQLLNRNDTARAEEFLDKAVKASPGNPAILELVIQVKVASKDWDGADAAVAELKKLSRNQVVVDLWSGLLAAERGQYDSAIERYQAVLDKQPNFARAWKVLAKAYQANGKSKELIRYLNDFIQNHPDNMQAYSLLASAYAEQKQWDNAEETLKKILEKQPDEMEFKLRLVNLVERRSQPEAEALLKQYVADKPQDLKLKSRLAAYYYTHKRFADADAVLTEIALADPSGSIGQSARLQLAQSALRQKDLSAASTWIEEALKTDPDNMEALLLRAGMRMDEKNFDGAIGDLKRIVEIRPDADRAMLMTAQAYLQKGEASEAENQWRKMLEVNPGSFQALAPLVAQMRQRGEDGLAETLVENANKAKPADPQIAELLVQLKAAKKDWLGAQVVVDRLKKQEEGEVSGEMLNGMLAFAQGHYSVAIRAYKIVLTKRPQANQALRALSQAYRADGQVDESIKFLKDFIQQHPESITAYDLLGVAYAAESKWTEAEKVLQQALQRQPTSLDTINILAGVMTKQGKTAEIEAVLRKAVGKVLDNPQVQMELAKHYEQSQEPDRAIATYRGLTEKYPDNNEVANNLADILVSYRNDQASIQQAVKLAERFKDTKNPYFLDTYGWVMLKAGQTDAALSALKKSVEMVPELAPIRYHLGEAFYQAGDKASAAEALKKALELAEKQGDFRGIEKARELMQNINGVA